MYIPRIWDTSIEEIYNTIYIINTTTPYQLTLGGHATRLISQCFLTGTLDLDRPIISIVMAPLSEEKYPL
jgi:hypothetical protein